ncbi:MULTISPECIES: replication endonuclease [Enterobacter cloacae complex]|uniref:replication endonuclease n=1 Tax=Enterobacter cloacae complex TaxID=354276 RepID=UPI0024497420|nr:replication endonuclease [Enterobacter kobei]HEC1438128.1 replication endonuclease [Enterobacter hormaechei]MDH0277856.1 replication endonuclease [Enterobacter kobei]MDH1370318.1 replication endonuclease [Enterobacter kobei]MDH1988628.1 replication endonuclease [Enterobacter kobei]MDH2010158.1 replication endonuclease [Enterobacter kobei]
MTTDKPGSFNEATRYAYPWNEPKQAIAVDKTPAVDLYELGQEQEFFAWVEDTLKPLPTFIRRRVSSRINAVHADKGRHIAKLTLRNIVARDLPHVRAVTEQYAVPVGSDWIISSELNPLFHTFENLRELTRRFNQLADSTDEDIDLLAQDIAIYANAALAEVSETYAVLSPVDYSKRMLREGSRLIAYFGLIAPWASRRKMPLDEMAASIRKILDDRFWSRLLRKYARRWREHLHIAFGDVRRDVSPYCSKNHVKQWDARRKRSREIMSRLELEDQVTGERMSLIEQIDKSVSNPEKRRVELMTRIGGFEKVATESGYAGSFFTLTAPSKYHAYTAFGHRNHKWNGASPRRSQRYLNQIWQQIRAELARREIPVFGLRVAESHHDGTPHWHGLLFTAPEHTAELKEVMEDYTTREDAEELTGKSGKQPRFELKPIDPALGSATGYVVKYISKNIDGYALDGENDHESGRPLKETAKHATAWASCWGIRQFQFVGGAPVSVWRELRRLRNQELADKVSPVFGELHRAAHAGDWQGYITLQGGPFVSRSRLVLRAWYQYKNEPTSYGEYQKSIKGLVMPASSIPPVETRLHSYRIVKMKPKSSDHADPDFDLKGASAPSWTRVNNCTEYKKHTTPSPLNPPDLTVPAGEVQPEQFEIGQLSREQRKQIAEDIRNHKSNQRVSPADQFEALALRITAGNCTDYDRARAESYMKAAHAIRQEACAVSEEVESLAQEIMGWAKLRKISINPVQALKLAQGGEVTALDTKYRANPLTGELIVTSADMRWRKTLARHKAETLVSRWREALIKF